MEPADRTASRRVDMHSVDLLSTLLLTVAAVATAWASYQAAHWRSEQGLAGNRSTAARVEANRAAGVANRQIQVDVATFNPRRSTSAASGPSSGQRSRRGSRRSRLGTVVWMATFPVSVGL